MNTYEFRPWREGDDLELLQVWGDPRSEQEAQQRASFGEASDAPFSRTLVVTDSGVPIAAGVVTAAGATRLISGGRLTQVPYSSVP